MSFETVGLEIHRANGTIEHVRAMITKVDDRCVSCDLLDPLVLLNDDKIKCPYAEMTLAMISTDFHQKERDATQEANRFHADRREEKRHA